MIGHTGDWNPVLAHALRHHSPRALLRRLGLGREQQALVLGAGALLYLAFLALALADLEHLDGWQATATVLTLLGLTVLAPLSGATSIARERQRQTWDVLLVTRLTPGQIVWGKFLGALLPSVGVLLLLAPLWLLGLALGETEPGLMIATLVSLPTSIVGLTALGLRCSANARSVGGAVSLALALTVILTLVVPLVELFTLGLTDAFRYLDGPPVSAALSPWVAFAMASEVGSRPGATELVMMLLHPLCYWPCAAVFVGKLIVDFERVLRVPPERR